MSYCLTRDERHGTRGPPSKSGTSTTDATTSTRDTGDSVKGVSRHRRTNPSYCCSLAGAESNTATGMDGTKTASSSTPERAKQVTWSSGAATVRSETTPKTARISTCFNIWAKEKVTATWV